MYKFYNIKKVKIILIFLSFIKYSAWCVFFIFQGRALQQAVDKNTLLVQLIYTLTGFLGAKFLVMMVDLAGKFASAYFENKEIAQQWKAHFPQKIYQDNEHKYNLIYLSYFDHLPNLYNLECIIINNQSTIISVFFIVTYLLIYTGFYYGMFALLAVFFLNFVSKNICLNKLNQYHKEINENKATTLGWINQYFKAYREMSFNWQGQIKPWIHSSYDDLYVSKKNLILVQLIRDIMAQLMVEVPFILNTSIVIIAVYLNYISITQMFVWVGFSQFIINASNSFLENKVNKDKKKILVNKLYDIAISFNEEEPLKINAKHYPPIENIDIRLQDNTINNLSTKPSIYRIKGTNGSGKTTLLNLIIGYEREVQINNYSNLKEMLAHISHENIRVIEREPVIFDSLNIFDEQVLGPKYANSAQWNIILKKRISGFLSKDLLNELSHHFSQIENKFYSRGNGRFSSGERILISLMRALTSWDKRVSILVVDECTAFLDTQIKELFLRCLSELSTNTSVYLSTHEDFNLKRPTEINLEVTN